MQEKKCFFFKLSILQRKQYIRALVITENH